MSSTHQAIAEQLGQLSSLHQALGLGHALRPAWTVVDVVVQDEYTHDVVFAPEDGAPDAIVLDCT